MAVKRDIVHIELSAKDRVAAGKFYSDMFGWKIEQMPDINYATFETGDGVGGGFNPITEESPAGTILIYIHSEDINADLVRIEELGGKALVRKSQIPGIGWWGLFEDPSGNKVALYTAMSEEERKAYQEQPRPA